MLKPFEQWFTEKHPTPREQANNGWILAAVRAHTRWGQGREVSEADFNTAVEEVCGLKIGGGPPPAAADDETNH